MAHVASKTRTSRTWVLARQNRVFKAKGAESGPRLCPGDARSGSWTWLDTAIPTVVEALEAFICGLSTRHVRPYVVCVGCPSTYLQPGGGISCNSTYSRIVFMCAMWLRMHVYMSQICKGFSSRPVGRCSTSCRPPGQRSPQRCRRMAPRRRRRPSEGLKLRFLNFRSAITLSPSSSGRLAAS